MRWRGLVLLAAAILIRWLLTSNVTSSSHTYGISSGHFALPGLEHKAGASASLQIGKSEKLAEVFQGRLEHSKSLVLTHEHLFLGLTPILTTPELPHRWATDAGGEPRVLMVGWSRDKYFGPYDNGGSRPLPVLTDSEMFFRIPDTWIRHSCRKEIWVTVAPQMQEFCSAATSPAMTVSDREEGTKDLTLRMAQLLGLPPETDYTHVVSMWVKSEDIFRPCFDPEIEDNSCQQAFTNSKRAFVTEAHIKWMTDRQRSMQSTRGRVVPWTQMGFTYDWGDTETHVGLSEFVIEAGAEVYVHSVDSLWDYCQPSQRL